MAHAKAAAEATPLNVSTQQPLLLPSPSGYPVLIVLALIGYTMSARFVLLLTVAQRRLHQWVQTNGEGLGAARHGVLLAIRDDDQGTPLGEVGRAVDLGASSLSGLIDRMAASGLVERMSDVQDGRAFRLRLTDDGRAARQEAIRQARILNDRMSAGFSEAELEVVSRWLTTVSERFAKGAPPDPVVD